MRKNAHHKFAPPLASLLCLLPSLLSLALTSPAPAATPTPQLVTSAEVDAAIELAKKYLYTQQNKQGHWESAAEPPAFKNSRNIDGQWGGRTALAVYALLSSGESFRDTKLTPAIEFLKKTDMHGTYSLPSATTSPAPAPTTKPASKK